MKKNAIVIASILFVAGCATNQGYSTARHDSTYSSPTSDVAMSRSTEMVARTPQGELIPPSDPSLSAQYDPAIGGFDSTVTGSASSDVSPRRNMNLSVGDYHADSSVQGGSNQARGWANENLTTEPPAAHPMNPAVQADSSMRGGSMRARQSDYYSPGAPATDTPLHGRIKADSSIRGGSNAARYGDSSFRSSAEDENAPSDVLVIIDSEEAPVMADDTDNDLGQGKSSNWVSDKDASVAASSNWNASDDLLQDGTQTEAQQSTSLPANDASIGGAASSETGSATSTAPLDDLDAKPSVDDSASSESGTESPVSPGSRKDLNSSGQLERDLQGDYNIDQSSAPTVPALPDDSAIQNSGNSTAVGGPGSTETGAASSSEGASGSDQSNNADITSSPDSGAAVTDSTHGGYSLFQNNRAQGIGSAATGQVGVERSDSTLKSTKTDDDLSEKVKSILVRETTGTSGVTQREVARNIDVTSHDGVVVLKGTVPDQKAKDTLDVRVREIAGVRRVDNQLTVQEPTRRTQDLGIGRNLEDTTDQLHDIAQ